VWANRLSLFLSAETMAISEPDKNPSMNKNRIITPDTVKKETIVALYFFLLS
jgi:hypothetical protein